MTWSESLLHQTRHHYDWLDHATADVDLARATWPAEGERPSIAWQLGHILVNADRTAEAVGGVERLVPRDRSAERHFGVADEAGWEELKGLWLRVSARTLSALEALPESALESAPAVEIHPAFRERLTTRREFWSGHVFHVAYHLGQLGSLRAAQGLGWS